MAKKILTDKELAEASYARFGPAGITMDVRGFLATREGQRLLKRIHEAAQALSNKPQKRRP